MILATNSTSTLLFVGVAILVFGLLKDAGYLDNVIATLKEWIKNLQSKPEKVPVSKEEEKKVVCKPETKCYQPVKEEVKITTPHLVKEWLDLRDGFDKAGVPVGKEKCDDMFVLLNIEKKG